MIDHDDDAHDLEELPELRAQLDRALHRLGRMRQRSKHQRGKITALKARVAELEAAAAAAPVPVGSG